MIEKHYWAPNPDILKMLESSIKPEHKVLELGPGKTPFSKATHFCGWDEGPQAIKTNGKVCDFNQELLPYKDNEFDFVYCRHVLEDIWNPFHAMNEMSRVGKAGYIETPSPIAELCRHVDGGSPSFRGYHHHRWIIWNDGTQINFVTKYSLLESAEFKFPEQELYNALKDPFKWNTYMLWNNKIKYKHQQLTVDFNIDKMDELLSNAVDFGMRIYVDDKMRALIQNG